MNTQDKRNQFIVAFQYLKPDNTWSKFYPLEDYVNIDKHKKVIGLALVDLVTANTHSLQLQEYYQNNPDNNTQFKFYPAQYNLEKQEVITIHNYQSNRYEH